ncbi:uncharacterized protein LOC108154171 [Drosophila miranda]|uniref:uncharacterized protein LOC108154171 n=1 Tax=Drosophila miranda TaxID=7229 RepID=UPI0007E6B765|nr:uncharacterized protein LOC108154171 [Drosophila miranda]
MIIPAETLDEMYVKEVNNIAKMIVKLPARDHLVPTCTRWLNIFHNASPEFRFERNWMLLQLHTQLNRKSNIGYPFTDPTSFHMDLRALMQRSDEMRESNDVDDDNLESGVSPEKSTISMSELDSDIHERNQQLLKENAALRSELKKLQGLEDELQQRKHKLKKMEMETRDAEEDMQILASSATMALKLLCTKEDANAKSQFFKTLFSPLGQDEKDLAQVEKLDTMFDTLLRDSINGYKQKQRDLVVQEVSVKYDNVVADSIEHYGKIMERKLVAQEKELAQSALRYLEVLRKHFVWKYMGNDSTKEAVLKFLKRSCQQMSEIL